MISAPGKKVVISKNGTNAQLQRAIEAAVPVATAQTKKIAKNFKGRNEKETAAKVFNYLKNQVNYKADRNEQNVQLPSAIMRDRQADCKSYSLFTMGVLNNLGIPAKLRYASYANDPTPTHVYVVTNKGTIIDAVYGKFNAEKPYTHKKDKAISGMNINYISGIGNMPQKNIGSIDWAKRTGVWDSLSTGEKAKVRGVQVLGLAVIARGLVLAIMNKNGGGLASGLWKLRSANPSAYRGIEIKWLKLGGDVDKFNSTVKAGATKTPTGKQLARVIKMVQNGETVGVNLWVRAIVSGLLGGRISGIGQADPVTATGEAVASAPWWAPFLVDIIKTLGALLITGAIAPASAADAQELDMTNPGASPTGGALAGAVPIIAIGLIGGLVYMAAKKGIKGKK
jgi:hypothetical protein